MKPRAILFVCMGNICRSPLAEGIFEHLARKAGKHGALRIDSAGTGGWHAGSPPDPRSIEVARAHGIDISTQGARQVNNRDFEQFDLILAMDEDNLKRLKQSCPLQQRHKLHLFCTYASGTRESVPDPYYGGEDGFLDVYNMLLAGCRSLLAKIEFDRAS
jgi:protein-tyrosine phosphatase